MATNDNIRQRRIRFSRPHQLGMAAWARPISLDSEKIIHFIESSFGLVWRRANSKGCLHYRSLLGMDKAEIKTLSEYLKAGSANTDWPNTPLLASSIHGNSCADGSCPSLRTVLRRPKCHSGPQTLQSIIGRNTERLLTGCDKRIQEGGLDLALLALLVPASHCD